MIQLTKYLDLVQNQSNEKFRNKLKFYIGTWLKINVGPHERTDCLIVMEKLAQYIDKTRMRYLVNIVYRGEVHVDYRSRGYDNSAEINIRKNRISLWPQNTKELLDEVLEGGEDGVEKDLQLISILVLATFVSRTNLGFHGSGRADASCRYSDLQFPLFLLTTSIIPLLS